MECKQNFNTIPVRVRVVTKYGEGGGISINCKDLISHALKWVMFLVNLILLRSISSKRNEHTALKIII